MKYLIILFLLFLSSCATPVKYGGIYIERENSLTISRVPDVQFRANNSAGGKIYTMNRFEGNNMSYSSVPSKLLGRKLKFLSNKAITVSHKQDELEAFTLRFEENRSINCMISNNFSVLETQEVFKKNFKMVPIDYEFHIYKNKIDSSEVEREFYEVVALGEKGRTSYIEQLKILVYSLKDSKKKYKKVACAYIGLGMWKTLERVTNEFAGQVFELYSLNNSNGSIYRGNSLDHEESEK